MQFQEWKEMSERNAIRQRSAASVAVISTNTRTSYDENWEVISCFVVKSDKSRGPDDQIGVGNKIDF